jgi:hypothetical protein
MVGVTHGVLSFGPKPPSNTPCPHTPLPNAWCSACAGVQTPAAVSATR